MGLFNRRETNETITAAPIPVPRFSIDGWTLSGVPLAAGLTKRLTAPDLRELETLLHGIAVQADTPYTYERAAVLLERGGEPGPALSVCEAWLSHVAAAVPEHVHQTKAVEKRRARLHQRLAPDPAPATAPS